MASLFVSHAGCDRGFVELVCTRLRAAGFAALFVDFDPEDGIPAGRHWERELYVQLRRTDAVIFLASAASVASRWCFAELSLARSLGRPIFPVRLEPGTRMSLLDDVQWIDLADVDADATRLLTGLHAAGLDPADAFAWNPRRPPYPGLAPFEAQDAAVFFGRQQETERLTELLQPTLARGPGRWVAIVGPSGSGKSSLLRAGLLPRLARTPGQWVPLPPLLPGRHPIGNLADCLAQAFAAAGAPRRARDLRINLRRGPSALVALAGELADLHRQGERRPNVLVVIDQAEELVIRTGPREEHAFLRLVTGALGEDSPLWVVATLRSEFLSTAPDRAGLAEALDDALVVEPLSRARLAEAIARPAQRAGLDLEAGLTERMVEDAAGGDALPLLAYTLRELAERAGFEGRITAKEYAGLGGVVGALQHRADRLAEELTRRGYGALVVPTLLKLVTVGPLGQPTGRRMPRSALSGEEHEVVDAFVEGRLLTSSGNPADPSGQAMVDVAHEALLRQWLPLRDAIEADQVGLRLRAEVERLATDWDQRGRGRGDEESYLLRGGRLATVDQWAREHSAELHPVEDQFLQASRALAARELETARRSNRRLQVLAGGLAVLLVAAVTVGALAVRANHQTEIQARLAMSRQLAARADELIELKPDTAILAGLQSLSLARDERPRPRPPAGLITGLARVTHTSRLLVGHTGPVWGVAFSPDGGLLATTSGDRTVRLWEMPSGRPHGQPLTGHTAAVKDVAFSPDGRLLATAGADRTVRLWDVATGRPHGEPITGHSAGIWAVAFSPDGRLLATAGADHTVRLWNVSSGRERGTPLTGHTDEVRGVAFSPDGRLLASASDDRTIRLWDMPSGRPHGQPLTGHENWVTDVEFSPDGKLLATSSGDQTVRLWEVATGRPHGEPITGHSAGIWAVVFSPDGRLLASASDDQTIRLWEAASGRPYSQPLTGHTMWADGVAFSPDGRLIASVSLDQTVRVWDVAETYSVSQPLSGHTDAVNGVAFSPDGRLLASASDDRTIRLWDMPSGRPHGPPLTGHTDWVSGVAFSPDGRLLATAGGDQTVRLWDVATGRPHGRPLTGHTDWVSGVAFSPDGRLLATAGGDQTVRLWDMPSGRAHGQPITGHTGYIQSVAFSPDGTLLATTSTDNTVRLWDVPSGRPHGPVLFGHTNTVLGVAFSPDGKLLATVSNDRTVRLWDVATGHAHGQPLTGHTDEVRAVAFSPDGRVLATASADGTARLWRPDFASWVAFGCKMVNRNLSMAEWEQLAPSLGYQRTCPALPPGEGAARDAPAARYSG
jgi:WD40 repeat protein